MKRLLLLPLSLVLVSEAAAEVRAPEPLSFLTSVEPSEVELGRPFVLRVEVRHRPEERYRLPKELALDPAVIRDVKERREEKEGVIETEFLVEAVIFDVLGQVELPSFTLEVEGTEGALEPLALPGASLTIRETGEGVELAPPPAPLGVLRFAWERLALVGGGLAALAAIVYFLRARRLRNAASAPTLSPAEQARRALVALRAEALWERGEGRLHYFRLSEIFRLYLRDAHGLAAVEMTTDELVRALGRAPLAGLSAGRAEAWLRRGDLARFAKGAIEGEQALGDLEELAEMIDAMEGARLPAAGGAEN